MRADIWPSMTSFIKISQWNRATLLFLLFMEIVLCCFLVTLNNLFVSRSRWFLNDSGRLIFISRRVLSWRISWNIEWTYVWFYCISHSIGLLLRNYKLNKFWIRQTIFGITCNIWYDGLYQVPQLLSSKLYSNSFFGFQNCKVHMTAIIWRFYTIKSFLQRS